jgi:RNase P subunit RPR2
LGAFIARDRAKLFAKAGFIIDTRTLDLSELRTQVDRIKLRTKSLTELTTRLIDQSFLRFKVSHGLLYTAQQSKERLDGMLKTMDSRVFDELSDTPVLAKKRPVKSSISTRKIICGHCEGILFNKKAYRVWTEDGGVSLLDMIVCYACKLEAQKLGINTERIKRSVAPHKSSCQSGV